MAKDFSKHIYASKQWKKVRQAYITSKHNLCERCGETHKYMTLHHKIELSPSNINDMEIVYGWNNLQLLCSPCHTLHHKEKYSPVKQGYKFDSQGNYIKIEGENENE